MSPPTLRILAPRARAFGTGDAQSLQNVCTMILHSGCACWVEEQRRWYTLDLAATDFEPPNIRPGCGPGAWVPLPG